MSEPISGNRDNECDYAKKGVPIKQTSQCQDGTPFAERRGQYSKVDIALNNEMLQELPPLVFYVVKTYEQGEDDLSKEVLSMIPTTWFAENSQTLFLYPPSNYCVAGKGPTNWASRTFDRHYFPNSSWLEYEAISIETTKGRDHQSVLKKYKKILKGVPADQITDSDIPLEKFRKRKRTTVDFSTPSSQNTFQHQCSQEKEMSCEGDSVVHTTAILAEQNNQLNTGCQEDPPLSEYESYNSMASNQPAGHTSPQNTAVVGTFNHLNELDNLEENEVELQDLQPRHSEIGTSHDGDTDLLQISLSSGVSLLNRLGSTHEQLDFNCNNGISNWSNSGYVEPLVVQHMPPDTHQPARDLTKYSGAQSYCNFGSQGLCTENSQHTACCTTIQSALVKLSEDVSRILSLLETNRDLVLSRSIPRMEIEFHESVIKSYDLQLPCDTVEKVVALDILLENTDLSVSFVMKFFNDFNGLKTINSFAATVYTSFVSKKTSEALQWKSIQRGEDCRQGIRHLLNLIAVIGVAVIKYSRSCSSGKEGVKTSTIIEMIQNSRKQEAELYRKEENISSAQAKILAKEAVPVSLGQKISEKQVISNIDRAIAKLEMAVAKFKVPQHF